MGRACRRVLVGFALVLSLVVGCKKEPLPPLLLDAPPQPESTTSVAPLIVPPVGTFPEPLPTTSSVAPTPSPSASATPRSPSSTALDRAREAALEGRAPEVRKLLGARVREGHGTPEEVRLLKGACQSMGDRACLDDLKAKYP